MVSNPEPNYLVFPNDADGPAVTSNTRRVDGQLVVDLLESQAWVAVILFEQVIGFASAILQILRKRC